MRETSLGARTHTRARWHIPTHNLIRNKRNEKLLFLLRAAYIKTAGARPYIRRTRPPRHGQMN